MWMLRHLFQYYLVYVCGDHAQPQIGCSPVNLSSYYFVHVSVALTEDPQ